MFKGCMVAVVTPMNVDGSIDKNAFSDLLEWHIESQTKAIIVAGSTGESATLDHAEQIDLISFAVQQAKKRIPIIAGTGTNSTKTSIELTKKAKEMGVDACLIVTPYYNKPTQQGLYLHYKTVADNVAIPIILYNVPSRTSCDMQVETVVKLSHINHIIGIKEATGKLDRVENILQNASKNFMLYSGDDATSFEFMKQGGHGVISVTANVAPTKMSELCDAALSHDFRKAEHINNELMLLHTRLFVETNPIPVKWALNKMKKIPLGIRLPLLPLDNQYHEEVKEAMQIAGVDLS
jgi:4-hydroxy-tetrahydrodipicolinate synthase